MASSWLADEAAHRWVPRTGPRVLIATRGVQLFAAGYMLCFVALMISAAVQSVSGLARLDLSELRSLISPSRFCSRWCS